MQIFYTPDIDSSADQYFLSEEESKHCIRVLRLEQNASVQLVDGKGCFYTAVIKEANAKGTLLEIKSKIPAFRQRNHYLHIALAPTKNLDRMEWFLEKATEIGIDEISFIICRHSERREIKTERLDKIIVAAMKQSVKAYHPVLNEALNFDTFIAKPFDGQKFIAHCHEGNETGINAGFKRCGRYQILIGPEGDFTGEEVHQAFGYGFKQVTLGNSRLRTETAALEACFEVNFLNR